MKNLSLVFVVFILFVLASCQYDDDPYAFFRKYYSNVFVTVKGAHLHTACSKDTTIKIDAYYARIQGVFTAVDDTIIQYGHVWSLTNPEPVITPATDTNYSKFYGRQVGETGDFETAIPLFPETEFFVRSYIITSSGDTGYNATVLVDTTLAPTDTWFKKVNLQAYGREGAASFTMKAKKRDIYNQWVETECGYVFGGKNSTTYYNDLWEYDPNYGSDGVWSSLNIFPNDGRVGAVGVAVTYYSRAEKATVTRAIIGLGEDSYGIQHNDFMMYNRGLNTWESIEALPGSPRKYAYAFSINGLVYVGGGEYSGAILNDLYYFNPNGFGPEDQPPSPPFWKQDPSPSRITPRSGAVAFVIAGKAFVGTGYGSDQNGVYKYLNDLWMFTPASDDGSSNSYWSQRSPMPAVGRQFAVGMAIDEQGYIGTGFDGQNILADFWRYDPFNDRWLKRRDYKNGQDENDPLDMSKLIHPPVMKAFGFGIGKKGYLGGGYIGEYAYTKYPNFFWVYRP